MKDPRTLLERLRKSLDQNLSNDDLIRTKELATQILLKLESGQYLLIRRSTIMEIVRELESQGNPCGKRGCLKIGIHRVYGSLTYYSCDDHLEEIKSLVEQEN